MKVFSHSLTKSSLFIILGAAGIFFQSLPFIIVAFALLVLNLAEKYLKIRIPTSFSWIFVIFVILSLVLGSYADFYEKYSWWDDMLHFSYGIGFAYIGFLIIYFINVKHNNERNIFLILLFSFCFSVAFGAIWEIYEYAMDTFFGMNMQRTENGVHDTMHDIILETTAAFITNVYIFAYLSAKQNNWINRLTQVFLHENKKSM